MGAVEVTIEPTRSFFQPKPRAQQKLVVTGQQFEDFDKVDRQRQRDGADSIIQKPFDIGLGQGALAELRKRLLLFGATA